MIYFSGTDSDKTSTLEIEREANDLKERIEKEGIDQVATDINKQTDNWKKVLVAIGVSGASGTGKSSFINTIRNVKPGERGFAKASSSGDTTLQKERYQFPNNEMIALDDLPGYGTTKFPKDEYVKRMEILNYDYILIFVNNVTESDIEFAKVLRKNDVGFAFVRSKLDIDLQNCVFDEETEEEATTNIQSKLLGKLGEAKLDDVPWFVISCRKQEVGQYENLVVHLENILPEVKRESVILSLLGVITSDLIERKFEILQKRILKRSLVSAAFVMVFPLVIEGFAIGKILVPEVMLYKSAFGFDQQFVKERTSLAEVRNRLHDDSLIFASDEKAICDLVISESGIGVVTGFILYTVPIIDVCVTATYFYRFLNRLLERCRDDALVVYSHLREYPEMDTNPGRPAKTDTMNRDNPHTPGDGNGES